MVKVDASEQFDVDAVQLNGGVAVKILVLSIDPYLRGRMREPEKGSYNVCILLLPARGADTQFTPVCIHSRRAVRP